jgi:hypothetical protein
MKEVVEVTGDEGVDYKLRLLIDTCVWLDIAKDYRQRPTIGALEELVKAGVIGLIVPRQVSDEFSRNKERIIKESGQSLVSTFRRVKDAVKQFGQHNGREEALLQLSDIDHRITLPRRRHQRHTRELLRCSSGTRRISTTLRWRRSNSRAASFSSHAREAAKPGRSLTRSRVSSRN